MQQLPVVREPAYFGDPSGALFGWLHHAPGASARDCVAVICAPIGYEYTHSHRSVRHLADRLARCGVPALRFDYHGTGDSPGTDLDPGRLARWQADILVAVAEAKAWSGRESVCLIGLRLGATLGAFAASDCDVDLLVLWNPCVKGRAFVRELQAIAMTAERTATTIEGALECAGFIVTAETIADLQKVDLTKRPVRARRRILLLGRDDQPPEPALLRHLAECAVPFDHENVPGWAGMMLEEQFTVVPDAALDTLTGWVVRNSALPSTPSRVRDALDAPRTTLAIAFDDIRGARANIEERLVRFGSDGHLFGVLSRLPDDRERPAIILLNAGSVHHVGPHRNYVALARNLAAMGFACLRFDLEGIGDSILRGIGRENHPYPDTAVPDARAALEALANQFGYRQFIPMGLCSGAFGAFHTGLSVPEHSIAELVVINPLTFYWKEGLSLATSRRFADMQMYWGSMRNPQRWMKLLRGDVNLRRPLEVALGEFASITRSYYGALLETLWPAKGPPLSRDLRKLFAMGRHVTFIIAQGDPGHDILMASARRTAKKALRSGQIAIEFIADADHTFSQSGPCRQMIERVCEILRPRLGGGQAPLPAPGAGSARKSSLPN